MLQAGRKYVVLAILVVALSGCRLGLGSLHRKLGANNVSNRELDGMHVPELPNPAVFVPTPPVKFVNSSNPSPSPALTGVHGFIVCMPIVSMGLTRDDEALANACALWLKLQVEGSPAAGGTQNWNTIFRAGAEQDQPNGVIAIRGLRQLGRATGISHGIVTRLTGNPGSLVFSAQIYSLNSGKPVSTAMAIGTSQSAIVHSLPLLARQLADKLDCKWSSSLTPVVVSPLSRFKALGRLPFRFDPRAYSALLPSLLPGAERDPLAAVLLLADSGSARHLPQLRGVALRLRELDPQNQFTVQLLSRLTWGFALREVATAALIKRHRHGNWLMGAVLARDYSHFCKDSRFATAASLPLVLASNLVHDSPTSPSAYRLAGMVCSRAAENLVARTENPSSWEAIRNKVEKLRHEAYKFSFKAVRLDPDYVAGWRQLISAAILDSHFKVAAHGVDRAEQLAPYDPSIYEGAIELYGARRLANDNDLVAATTHYAALVSSPYAQYSAVVALRKSKLQNDANGLLNNLIRLNENWRKTSALALSSTLKLGVLEMLSFRTADANRHFERVLQVDPHNSGALAGLGTLAYRDRNAIKTRRYLDAAISTDPSLYRVYSMDAWASLEHRDWLRARRLISSALENQATCTSKPRPRDGVCGATGVSETSNCLARH